MDLNKFLIILVAVLQAQADETYVMHFIVELYLFSSCIIYETIYCDTSVVRKGNRNVNAAVYYRIMIM